jgi:hypothetical protein
MRLQPRLALSHAIMIGLMCLVFPLALYSIRSAITCGTVNWAWLMGGRDPLEEERGAKLWILREPI